MAAPIEDLYIDLFYATQIESVVSSDIKICISVVTWVHIHYRHTIVSLRTAACFTTSRITFFKQTLVSLFDIFIFITSYIMNES